MDRRGVEVVYGEDMAFEVGSNENAQKLWHVLPAVSSEDRILEDVHERPGKVLGSRKHQLLEIVIFWSFLENSKSVST